MKDENMQFYWEKNKTKTNTKKDQSIRIDVPGFGKKEIKVSLTDNFITVTALKKDHNLQRGKGFYHEEAYQRSFRKSIPLPYKINKEEINVSIVDNAVILKKKDNKK